MAERGPFEIAKELREEAENCDIEDRLDLSNTAKLLREAAEEIGRLDNIIAAARSILNV
jgi:NAD(P)-dependent dehydrogenase (short-subunit alcohol dehydrogenase family)